MLRRRGPWAKAEFYKEIQVTLLLNKKILKLKESVKNE